MKPSTVIRPIKSTDLDALYQMAEASGIGFTSLPINRDFLENKIALAEASFARADDELTSENYLMVMEDTTTGNVVGTTAIAANVGADEIFYSYKVGRLTKACQPLNIRMEHETLTLTTDHQGATELCTLFLMPEARQGYNGQLLSRSRFLFMGAHEPRFSHDVIAEMRGVSDADGHSPFWDALGRHFFDNVQFPQADYMTGMGEKQFIADLMPEFRLYVCMLPEAAQKAIGQTHEKTTPALRLLEREHFSYRGYVDIFDAGPTVEAQMRNIHSIRHQKVAQLGKIADAETKKHYIVSNDRLDFRACVSPINIDENNTITLPKGTAEVLNVQPGDTLRYLSLRGRKHA